MQAVDEGQIHYVPPRAWSPKWLCEWLEPSLGPLEAGYRQHFLKQDGEQAVLGMAFLSAPAIILAAVDAA